MKKSHVFNKTFEKQVHSGNHKIVSVHGGEEALPYYSSNLSCSPIIFLALDYVYYITEHFKCFRRIKLPNCICFTVTPILLFL